MACWTVQITSSHTEQNMSPHWHCRWKCTYCTVLNKRTKFQYIYDIFVQILSLTELTVTICEVISVVQLWDVYLYSYRNENKLLYCILNFLYNDNSLYNIFMVCVILLCQDFTVLCQFQLCVLRIYNNQKCLQNAWTMIVNADI